ncbi:hypothetical protein Pelo_12164 [Pelomyxa schiedti]|nr:hypothetical protein Pelo_12164 [Pelomyxa schiedti]
MGASNSGALSREEQENIRRQYAIPPDKFDVVVKSFNTHAGKDGRITKPAFMTILSGVMCADLADKVFESFDRDGSGFMDVREYLAMMGVTHGGTLEQKLEASYQLFDKDGDGRVTRDEVREMFIMVVKQKRVARTGGSTASVVLDKTAMDAINQVVETIFTKVDTDRSGWLSKEEFMVGFTKNPDVCGFFKQF